MRLLAVDPGTMQSAYVLYQVEDGTICQFGITPNEELLARYFPYLDHVAIEEMESFGMAVGREIFRTVFWSGRFVQAWGAPFTPVTRRSVKIHLCHSMRAKDGNIRQALIDRFGPPGTKKEPGRLYGVSRDVWSALAIAVTLAETTGAAQQAHAAAVF